MPESRLSQGPPAANLRPLPPPSIDPAEASTLAMLGTSPLDQMHGGAMMPGEGGGAGEVMGAIAGIAQLVQKLAVRAPALVPPEITMWLEQLMVQGPQLVNQQTSGMGMMRQAVGAGTPMPSPGAALGPAPAPGVGASGPPSPRPPM